MWYFSQLPFLSPVPLAASTESEAASSALLQKHVFMIHVIIFQKA